MIVSRVCAMQNGEAARDFRLVSSAAVIGSNQDTSGPAGTAGRPN